MQDSSVPKEAFKQPLPRSFYGIVLKLEEQASKKTISMDDIGKLTSMYGDIVSYYDALQDPIKFYFIEKIQTLLAEAYTYTVTSKLEPEHAKEIVQGTTARKQSSQSNSKQPQGKKQVARSLSQSSKSSDSSDEENGDQVAKLPGNVQDGLQAAVEEAVDERPRNVSISTMKKTRQKKMSLMIQLNKAQEEESPNQYNQLMGTYEQSVSKNDESIKQQLRDQSDQLQQRIESRRQNRKKNGQSLGGKPEEFNGDVSVVMEANEKDESG